MDSVGSESDRCPSLIVILLDKSARWDERDDAAMDLADFDEPEALEALLRVAGDPTEGEVLLETVGDAIAEILGRHPDRVIEHPERLAPRALKAIREWRQWD